MNLNKASGMVTPSRPSVNPVRRKIVDEAMTWMGTPYHHMARVKGAGVDCLTLIVEVYEHLGLITHHEVPFYRPDFMRHNSEDTYLDGLLRHGFEVPEPRMGDVAIFKWGRIHAHAGIIISWPEIIHAEPVNGVIIRSADNGRLRGRPAKFISLFGAL